MIDRTLRVDAAIAVALAAVQVAATYAAAQHQPERHTFNALAAVLLAGASLVLTFRRRWPRTVLWATLAFTLVYWVIGYGRGPVFFSLILAFGTAVYMGRRRGAVTALAVGYVGFLWLAPALGREDWPGLGAILGLGAWLLVLWSASEWVRLRHERAIEAAHVREEEQRRRVSEERLRLARELHDVLAHNISLINVQASTTLHLIEHDGTDESSVRAALGTIKKVSQETLSEVRSVLGVLRQVDEAAPTAPAPTLARLDELVAGAASAGVDVEIAVEGEPVSLPAAVDLAGYRIAQESLTNVLRHAHARHAAVRVAYASDAVTVEVVDDGIGAATEANGNGIAGMRERATALHGTFDAGPRANGGFRVRAWLPLDVDR